MALQALRLHAGPAARRHIARHGLQPGDIGVVAGAAGGPKGLILGPLDRYLFGQWLPQSAQAVDLVGASIGAWRMATACLPDAVAAFERLEHDYIRQHYALQAGEKRPPPERVSALFAQNLQAFFGGREAEVLTLAVSPACRRRGIARALTEAAARLAGRSRLASRSFGPLLCPLADLARCSGGCSCDRYW